MHNCDAVDEQDSVDLDTLLTEGFDLEQHEQLLIVTDMHKAKQNVSEAVRLLGISSAALDYRLKKYAMR
ncbi:helix-turn-helix domain-containing protein [Acinetobacter towneri]|uniref:helix-turn-helix domain-containing protein n=1 Tax=Acinetobacter towneri TaxID=202956 RepID=UPI0003AAEF85